MRKSTKAHQSDVVRKRVAQSPALREHYARDIAMLSVTAALIAELDEQGVSRAELARRIGRPKAFVTQVLSGSRNMTLRTVADIAAALGKEVCGIQLRELGTVSVSAQALDRHLDERTLSAAS